MRIGPHHGRKLIAQGAHSPVPPGARRVTVAGSVLGRRHAQDKTIELPMSSADYENLLIEKGEQSTFQKTKVVAKATADDFAKSFR